MRKNQKYSKEEMYMAIELWHESGLSQSRFCSLEKLSLKAFSYWLQKYRNEKRCLASPKKSPSETFIPIELPQTGNRTFLNSDRIDISFPNGVQLNCPARIDIGQLKTLINF
jgi:hypothetical protein